MTKTSVEYTGDSYKIHIETLSGNFHDAAVFLNMKDWAKYLVSMVVVGNYTQIVLKMPTELVHSIRLNNRSWAVSVHFDDPK